MQNLFYLELELPGISQFLYLYTFQRTVYKVDLLDCSTKRSRILACSEKHLFGKHGGSSYCGKQVCAREKEKITHSPI